MNRRRRFENPQAFNVSFAQRFWIFQSIFVVVRRSFCLLIFRVALAMWHTTPFFSFLLKSWANVVHTKVAVGTGRNSLKEATWAKWIGVALLTAIFTFEGTTNKQSHCLMSSALFRFFLINEEDSSQIHSPVCFLSVSLCIERMLRLMNQEGRSEEVCWCSSRLWARFHSYIFVRRFMTDILFYCYWFLQVK